MLHYRLLHAINEGYALTVLWVYILMFALALALMFVFPPGTILLLWIGLVSLGLVVILARLLTMLEHLDARLILRAGCCPRCGHRMQSVRDETLPWSCEMCGQTFVPSGAAAEPDTA